jgi:hypothetical protein
MTQKQQQTAAAKARPRYVTPDKVRTLKCDATVAQDAYILATLELLADFGTLRAQTIGKALFSGRSEVAAHAAAKRTLKACVERKLIESRRKPGTQHVYYALTRAGAMHINERGALFSAATSGRALLTGDMLKANHREWVANIVIAARKRDGVDSFGELAIQREPSAVSTTLVDERFKGQHAPDALTFNQHQMVVVWHEVELSRRNAWSDMTQHRKESKERDRAKKAGVHPRVMRSGRDQFVHLMRTLREAYVLCRADGEYRLVFVAHCATKLICQELSRLVEQAFTLSHRDGMFRPELEVLDPGMHYRVNYNNGKEHRFDVYLQMLPCADVAEAPVFSQEMLWPDAPHHLREDPLSDKFIARPKRKKSKR